MPVLEACIQLHSSMVAAGSSMNLNLAQTQTYADLLDVLFVQLDSFLISAHRQAVSEYKNVAKFLADPSGGLEVCRYADVAFPEPGEYEPQQIHITPASAPLRIILHVATTLTPAALVSSP